MEESPEATADLVSVLAHGWLNSISVVASAAMTLQQNGDTLSVELRDMLLTMMVVQAAFLDGAVNDVLG